MTGLAYDLDFLTNLIEREAGNYVVSMLLYEVDHRQGATPEEIVQTAIRDAKIANCAAITVNEVLSVVAAGIDYQGDESHGPTRGILTSREFVEVRIRVLAELKAALDKADRIIQFAFIEGHPAYPVYWDFAYVIGGQVHSLVLVGSSSD